MAIVAADLVERLSGGAANTSPAAALGGAMSTAAGGIITDNVKNNLWPDVSGAESASGITRYRGTYWRNETAGGLTLQSPAIYIPSVTPSTSTEIDVGLAAEAVNVTMATIANETTAPASVTFSRPSTRATGLTPPNLAPNDFKGLWQRLTVTAGASAFTGDVATIRLEGDTAA